MKNIRVDIVGKAIHAFKLGWSSDTKAYDTYMFQFNDDERKVISQLIFDNERKWISTYRRELTDYTPVYPVATEQVSDANGELLSEGDILTNNFNTVKLIIRNDLEVPSWYLECIEAGDSWSGSDGMINDTCLSYYTKVKE